MTSTMSGHERFGRILQRQPVDRIGLYEHFWGDTQRAWAAQGHIKADESLDDHFGFDCQVAWVFRVMADLDWVNETLEETEETILTRDGNGAILRRHKQHDSTPEHVDFTVKDREKWEELIKPKLTVDRRRIDFDWYRRARQQAADAGRFFFWGFINVFECIHPVCGHENMLMGMVEDPEWVEDMVTTYSQLIIDLQELLFAEEGAPDGIWYFEDLGFKERPFMSPNMYREIIQPGHVRTISYAHSRNLPVVMHSCGFIEPLLPGMLEAGIDALQVMEVKAGMDPLRIHKQYGDRLSLIGGIDVRTLCSNDRAIIDAELEAKIPTLMQGYGYALHTDHSVPATVEYDNYRYFIEKGLELGTY
ncbi:MAG: uroporphyrinogen decarboxylase family protein [bacterium]